MFFISLRDTICCVTRTMPTKPRIKWGLHTVIVNSQTKSIIQASNRNLWSECEGHILSKFYSS